MGPDQKKRARPVPSTSQRSKKRQKIERMKKDAAEKRAVALDALPWSEVQMPDMFEDAEGFYGLEEVEGIEVVRDGKIVQFVSLLENFRGQLFIIYRSPQQHQYSTRR